jgi:ribosomal protein S18 acetylase RimI-like enzyme
MVVERVLDVTDEILSAVHRLVPEIGTHKPLPTRDELTALVRSEASTLWIARYPDQSGTIAGMLTISLYRVPTGLRSIVEDVAVASNLRRKGIARALMQAAIDFARACGANGIALTSNPRREAANRLYLSLGFERRETNSYFFRL